MLGLRRVRVSVSVRVRVGVVAKAAPLLFQRQNTVVAIGEIAVARLGETAMGSPSVLQM